jgi:hypothetical protein
LDQEVDKRTDFVMDKVSFPMFFFLHSILDALLNLEIHHYTYIFSVRSKWRGDWNPWPWSAYASFLLTSWMKEGFNEFHLANLRLWSLKVRSRATYASTHDQRAFPYFHIAPKSKKRFSIEADNRNSVTLPK